jgi:hypothetical protein
VGLVGLLALVPGAQAGDDSHGASAAVPVVTLKLRTSGTSDASGATLAIAGTFRGRALAGRRVYRLLPVGGATATHKHGTAAAQRARVEEVFLDARSGSEYLRVLARGSLTGGPAIAGPSGACRRIAVRHALRRDLGVAVLRWACRPAGDDEGPPIHHDVVRRPRDTIASSYTIVTRPCPAAERKSAGSGPSEVGRDRRCA